VLKQNREVAGKIDRTMSHRVAAVRVKGPISTGVKSLCLDVVTV